MKILVFVLLVAASPLIGQTAEVIQLSPEDAATAKSLDDQQKSLSAKIENFRKYITNQYLTTKNSDEIGNCAGADSGGIIKAGWGCGEFEYSDDFRFVVPQRYTLTTSGGGALIFPGCGYTTTPSSGSIPTTPGN